MSLLLAAGGAAPVVVSVAGQAPARKRPRRYWVEVAGQVYEGSLAEVQAFLYALAERDAAANTVTPVQITYAKPSDRRRTVPLPFATAQLSPENNTPTQLQQLYVAKRGRVAPKQQSAYDVALEQHLAYMAELDDEEAIVLLLH